MNKFILILITLLTLTSPCLSNSASDTTQSKVNNLREIFNAQSSEKWDFHQFIGAQTTPLREKTPPHDPTWKTKAKTLVFCDKEDLFTGSEAILNCDTPQTINIDVFIDSNDIIIMTETPQIYSILEVVSVSRNNEDASIFLCHVDGIGIESGNVNKCLIYLIPNGEMTFVIAIEWSNVVYYYLCDL